LLAKMLSFETMLFALGCHLGAYLVAAQASLFSMPTLRHCTHVACIFKQGLLGPAVTMFQGLCVRIVAARCAYILRFHDLEIVGLFHRKVLARR